jgi:hypothetical protein
MGGAEKEADTANYWPIVKVTVMTADTTMPGGVE